MTAILQDFFFLFLHQNHVELVPAKLFCSHDKKKRLCALVHSSLPSAGVPVPQCCSLASGRGVPVRG